MELGRVPSITANLALVGVTVALPSPVLAQATGQTGSSRQPPVVTQQVEVVATRLRDALELAAGVEISPGATSLVGVIHVVHKAAAATHRWATDRSTGWPRVRPSSA
jgi:hypothetical protein